ncbi:MAG: flagellar filament capping protein FliD [Candidatus Melainabacteria bacterium]|nr:flagellar filament capping protein FliD [Candidatus Melainabacteria bacterium]
MAVSFIGLNSSFDSGALINQLITLEVQSRISPLQQKITELNREDSFLSAIANDVTSLKGTVDHKNISRGDTELASKSVTTTNNADSAGTENYYAEITATDDAVVQNFDLTVDQLATSSSRKSTARVDNGVTGASAMSAANLKGVTSLTTGTVTIDGETQTSALTDSSTINDVLTFLQTFAAVSTATMDAEGRIAITGTAGSIGNSGDTSNLISALGLNNAVLSGGSATGLQKLTAAKSSTTLNALPTPITGTTLTINGTDVTYDPATDSITTLVDEINSTSATGVNASYDDINGELILTNKDTGALSITVSSNGNADTVLNIAAAGAETLGNNAEFTISTLNGGATLVNNDNTVTGLIEGLTFELKNTTPTGPSVPVNVAIAEDVDSIVTKITTIIDQVNDMIQDLEAQDDSFSRQMIRRLKNTMGTAYSGLSNDYASLIEIGITSDVGTDTSSGFQGYTLDRDTFETAFLDDRADFLKILYGTSIVTDPDAEITALSDGSEGVITLLQRALDEYVDPDVPTNGLINQIQDSISTQIDTANDRIERAQQSIDALEDRLTRQFSQLDIINAQFQQQQQAIQSTFGGGTA